MDFTGFADVDLMSTGYRIAATWGKAECRQLTFGTDLRYLEQELNEIDAFDPISGGSGAFANFPIPRSHSSNPGLFVEYVEPVCERLAIRSGARVDWVSANREGETFGRTDADLAFILGSGDFDRDFALWAVYVTADFKYDDHWRLSGGFGHGKRPPRDWIRPPPIPRTTRTWASRSASRS